MKLFKQWNPHIKLNIVVLPIFSCSWHAGRGCQPECWLDSPVFSFQFALEACDLRENGWARRQSHYNPVIPAPVVLALLSLLSITWSEAACSSDCTLDSWSVEIYFVEPLPCVLCVTCCLSNDEGSGQTCGHARPQPSLQPPAIFTLPILSLVLLLQTTLRPPITL